MNRADFDRLTNQLMDRVRGPEGSVLDRWAELLHDLLLDWDLSNERDARSAALPELPAMAEDAFIYLMRGKVEATLREVARAINDAPTGDIIARSEGAVCRLLAELWTDALETGVQLRLDTAVSTGVAAPQGEWARRLRRMNAAGSDLPLSTTAKDR